MTIGMLYWLLWLIWLIFGGWAGYNQPAERRWLWGGNLLLLILLFLIGWKVFGFVIKD